MLRAPPVYLSQYLASSFLVCSSQGPEMGRAGRLHTAEGAVFHMRENVDIQVHTVGGSELE